MITLSDFIEMWAGKRMPILVYSSEDLDDIEKDIDLCKKWEDYEYSGEFCLNTDYSQFKTMVYLKDKYANSIVRWFFITPEGMVIFIRIAEQGE